MKKGFRNVAVAVVAMAALFLAGCGLDAGLGGSVDAAAVAFSDGNGGTVDGYSAVLYAGQTTVAGSVDLSIDDDTLVVTYNTVNGWELTEVHFAIGTKSTDIPVNRAGNPVIGSFPYSASNLNGVTSYAFRIPVAVLGITDVDSEFADVAVHAAAHAVVRLVSDGVTVRTETGWAGTTRFVQRGSWATQFGFVLRYVDDSTDPEPEMTSETAFAYGGAVATTFDVYVGVGKKDDDKARWGWSNGPLAEGSYTFPIYAGAGGNDITKGTLVGTLSVVYTGGSAVVSYTMNAGFLLDEVHLHVGSEPLARKGGEYTIAPGQYGLVAEDLGMVGSATYTVSGLSGEVYVVAHAVVFSANW